MMNNQSMIKDEVYKQDMPNDMIKACQSAARRALQESSYGSSSNKEQAMASSVRKAMESQYPGTWSCVCGQRFGRHVFNRFKTNIFHFKFQFTILIYLLL